MRVGFRSVKLAIFDATDNTGRRLLERALAEEHQGTASASSARRPSRPTARHERPSAVAGDVRARRLEAEKAAIDRDAAPSVSPAESPATLSARSGPGSARGTIGAA
ncbi:hypothetical protein Rxyl_2823 [Rubrobacter xylanophilus DSM 9941]|uniref:Uncharacterized protein n=1 Tax=Rubrobacter xylanophilus (strain DSM 9941 / JCM 11954 / NBRC 16129 / PRD-1) TaxID=266117 RepID=Q1AS93_RUBXD|nr:hypothetical protein Rxyl_2823 [Rubrobacter xylanophilus DSM 9941]